MVVTLISAESFTVSGGIGCAGLWRGKKAAVALIRTKVKLPIRKIKPVPGQGRVFARGTTLVAITATQ